MKSARLLTELLLLQAHGKLSGRALAGRLAVSMRTAHRDMEALSAAGVPVFALRGSAGGWQLEAGWRTRVPGLDESELRALLMAQPRVLGDARLAASAERALAKLMAALPDGLRDRAVSIRQRLHIDTTGWRGSTEQLSALPIVQDAISHDRQLEITYRQANRERVQRTVEPYGLVAKGTTWYLVANTPRGFRTYRVSRIEQPTMLAASFKPPADFDLAAHWTTSTRQFYERERYEATLRLEPGSADSVRQWCDVAPDSSLQPIDPDGWITLRLRFDSESSACFIVMGFGPRVEVVEPKSLRTRVETELAAALRRVRGPRPRRPTAVLTKPTKVTKTTKSL
jgi:predicted DNA-binding transcriptional regulator YafY